jgi:hypothetical protein
MNTGGGSVFHRQRWVIFRATLTAEDPVRGAHGPEGEHERLAAKFGPASLAHPHLAAHLPGGALDHGETRNTKDLAARVVDLGISDRAQEDGRRHRSELRDRKKCLGFRRVGERLHHRRLHRGDLALVGLEELELERDLVAEHALGSA